VYTCTKLKEVRGAEKCKIMSKNNEDVKQLNQEKEEKK